jgi:hypothetical protein
MVSSGTPRSNETENFLSDHPHSNCSAHLLFENRWCKMAKLTIDRGDQKGAMSIEAFLSRGRRPLTISARKPYRVRKHPSALKVLFDSRSHFSRNFRVGNSIERIVARFVPRFMEHGSYREKVREGNN